VSRGLERELLPALAGMGIGVTAYGVLSRGLLSGSRPTGAGDYRAHLPRFTGANAAANQRLADALAALARDKGVTPAQLAIAWVLTRGERIVPVVGARTPKQLGESLAALAVRLSPAELASIEAAVPEAAVAGTRYDAHQMAALDSER
jgi:aryl-alcohol dehydrogenase-like predicted oxidoreductase